MGSEQRQVRWAKQGSSAVASYMEAQESNIGKVTQTRLRNVHEQLTQILSTCTAHTSCNKYPNLSSLSLQLSSFAPTVSRSLLI
jgi:hypothetical protein